MKKITIITTFFFVLILKGWAQTPDLSSNQPDGPYIFYTETGAKVVSVDTLGFIHEDVYSELPPNFSFDVYSTANEPGTNHRSKFTVTLHPNTRIDWRRPAPDSLIVISDPHAKWAPFVSILKAQKVINDQLKWSFGKNELMIIGDIFDRGDDATTIFWLVYQLQQEARDAGGEVYFIYGNHEEMELRNSSSCYSNGYIYQKYIDICAKYFNATNQYGSLFFNSGTELGRWLAQCNSMQIIGNDLYVHAGLSSTFYDRNYTIPQVNEIMSADIMKTSGRDAFLFASSSSAGGPLWYRGMIPDYVAKGGYTENPTTPRVLHLTTDYLGGLLRRYEAERIIIGHTEHNAGDGPIAYSDYDYRVVNVNVQTQNAMDAGRGRGILIEKNGKTSILYDTKPNKAMSLPENPIPEGPANDNQLPTGKWIPKFSTDTEEYWYYIQFVSTGYVVDLTGNGDPALMTVETAVKGRNEQLWKAEYEGKTTSSTYPDMPLVILSNKAYPNLKIRYITSSGEGATQSVSSSGFYACSGTGSYGSSTGSTSGNPILITGYNGTEYVSLNGRNASYNIRPQTMGLSGKGSRIYRDGSGNPNAVECEIKFISEAELFTGNDKINKSQANLYPNPVKGKLNVNTSGNATKLAVCNSSGRELFSKKLNGQETETVDISSCSKGVYFLKIVKPSGIETSKFIVN
jgi:hypothetical protein